MMQKRKWLCTEGRILG